MLSIPKPSLILLLSLVCTVSIAQGKMETDLSEVTDQWIYRLSELQISMIELPEMYLSADKVLKAGGKITKSLQSSLDKLKEDPGSDDVYDELAIENTNASLWYSQVTSNSFQTFLKRMVMGRPISKNVIEDLKKKFYKWIKNPSIKNLDRYSKLLLETGRSYEILTKLQVRTEEIEGITIKYSPLNREGVKTLRGPLAEKVIPVGNYFVWLEKDGKILSDNTNGFPCITARTEIFLQKW